MQKLKSQWLCCLVVLTLCLLAESESRLTDAKIVEFGKPLKAAIELPELENDFHSELEKLLMQATAQKSKNLYDADKALALDTSSGASCSQITKTIKQIQSVMNEMQKIVESESICPPVQEGVIAIMQKSPIFANQKQPTSLAFLASRVSKFKSARKIFTTRDFNYSNVAFEFHQACDNIPNTLVIIKSGDFIAGGFTKEPWDSPGVPFSRKPTYAWGAYVFSVNRQRAYDHMPGTESIYCHPQLGPVFGIFSLAAIRVVSPYGEMINESYLYANYDSAGVSSCQDELFGGRTFKITEYEVYALE